jgi:hypothetical protein
MPSISDASPQKLVPELSRAFMSMFLVRLLLQRRKTMTVRITQKTEPVVMALIPTVERLCGVSDVVAEGSEEGKFMEMGGAD